jgi:hypothetical protein
LFSKPFNHLSRFERCVLNVDYICCLNSAEQRVLRAALGAATPRLGFVRHSVHNSQAKTAREQEHRGCERIRVAVGHLTLQSRMRQQVEHFKQPLNLSISNHCNGYRDLRLVEPFQCRNRHHQLKQASLCQGALRCARAPWAITGLKL